ncbi:hypothetical protein H2248_012065 [Termitomyces sp. 'cryptogamus']|nr:hypothetical protein H2248_012065 [Termitomyces sp. 'cryptogamus']
MYVHSNHIPQPPHSAGLRYQGLRPRIDASQVPSPIQLVEEDRLKWEGRVYMTLPGEYAPASTSDFTAIDQGSASPKFARVTTWKFPSSSRLAHECAIPLAAVFQPFAELDRVEEPVPLVHTEKSGPARCERCRAYINPWCLWVSGGTRWKCNLCGHDTEVSAEYFCSLDANLMRLDYRQRPELMKGTVDFVVPEEYWAINPPQALTMPYHTHEPRKTGSRPPEPMKYIFALDVSYEAVQLGLLRSACACISRILFGGTGANGATLDACFPPECSIAFLTYDSTIHFYDLLADPVKMLVVSDIEEVFVPLQQGLFVNPIQRRDILESFLEILPTRFENASFREAALGSLLRSCHAALAGYGGQVFVFSGTMPTVGIGQLGGQPNETDLFNTDKERVLYQPRDNVWIEMGQDCAADGIGVHMIMAPIKYMDVGSIGTVATLTGGDLLYHPRYDPLRDEIVLESQLQRLMRRMQGYNCITRIRSSHGINVTKSHYGNFYQTSPTTLEFGVLDADKAISVALEHSGRTLSSRDTVHLQCSVLYTTVSGERRARVCNLALQVADLAGNVFQFADLDTTVCHMAREALASRTKQKMSIVREELTEKCGSLLLGYRKNCAAASRIDQMILPEVFKTLPSYILALAKSKPLKGLHVSSDVRNYHAHRMNSMPIRSLMHYIYPQLMALHDLEDDVALPYDDEFTRIHLPSVMRSSHTFMEANGIYLVDNEETSIFWIGHSVSSQLLLDLFGVDDIMALNPKLVQLPTLETRLSNQVRNILNQRRLRRGRITTLLLARQNLDAAELEFSDMLVEDQNNGNLSYTDYLALVHKQIVNVLKNGGSISGASSMRGGPPW